MMSPKYSILKTLPNNTHMGSIQQERVLMKGCGWVQGVELVRVGSLDVALDAGALYWREAPTLWSFLPVNLFAPTVYS